MTPTVRTAEQAAKDAVVFKALANAVRLQIVSYVAASEEGQVSAGAIVERFDLSQPTISHHLRVLREAGVLTTHKASTYVYYRFAPSLHEVVTSILPRAAAAEPPVVAAVPQRRATASADASSEPTTQPEPAASVKPTTATEGAKPTRSARPTKTAKKKGKADVAKAAKSEKKSKKDKKTKKKA